MVMKLRQLSKVGAEIVRKRTDRKWSQAELARRSGVSRHTISRLETGKATDVLWSNLNALAQTLDGLRLIEWSR